MTPSRNDRNSSKTPPFRDFQEQEKKTPLSPDHTHISPTPETPLKERYPQRKEKMMMKSQIKNDTPPAQYFDSVNTVDRQPLVQDDTDTRPPRSRRKEEEELEEQEEER